MSGEGRIVRVLFGESAHEAREKIAADISEALKPEWSRRDVVHFVAGRANAALLRKLGAEQIVKLGDAPLHPDCGRYGIWYTKVWLLREAMKLLPEILYLDFDCEPLQEPDRRMWKLLREKGGPLGGTLQACYLHYTVPHLPKTQHRRTGRQRRSAVNAGLIYCSDRDWMECWIDMHRQEVRAGSHWKTTGNEECSLTMLLDEHFGRCLDDAEAVAVLSPSIARMRHERGWEGKDPGKFYFHHGH